MADSGISSALDSLLGDRYTREARLGPAFLCFFPILLVMLAWFHGLRGAMTDLLTLLCLFGVVRWISHIAREVGDRVEIGIFREWRGKPTTIMLRQGRGLKRIEAHAREPEIEHFLSEALPEDKLAPQLARRNGVPLPLIESDKAIVDNKDLTLLQKAKELDSLYEPTVGWLRENTRDNKLVQEENISYGFQRNLYSLKRFALITCAIALAIEGVAISMTVDCTFPYTTPPNIAVVGALLAYFIGVCVFVTRQKVRDQAFAYARQLIFSVYSIPAPESQDKTLNDSQ
jgi:hypothetical protein